MKKALVICGPTASGKTDYAHRRAQEMSGEIINCDSMQVYQQIPIISASGRIRDKSCIMNPFAQPISKILESFERL